MEILGDWMKKIVKYMIAMLFTFTCITSVNAFQNVARSVAASEGMCPSGSCVKLCEYDDRAANLITKNQMDPVWLKEYENGNVDLFQNFTFIGYYYNGDKGVPARLLPSNKGWVFSFPVYKEDQFLKTIGTGVVDTKLGGLIYYSIWSDIPSDDIYSLENVQSMEELKTSSLSNWKDTALYRNLNSNMECPKFIYGNTSIGFYNFSALGDGIPLVYSFKSEAEDILKNSLSELSWRFYIGPKSADFENTKRIQFISDVENSIDEGYPKSNNGEKINFVMENGSPKKESLEKYCPYFKNLIEKDKGLSYSEKLYERHKDVYKAKINEILQKYADTASVRDTAIYTYDNLYTVLSYIDNNTKGYRIESFKNFENLLVEDITDSLDYLAKSCSAAGVSFEYDKSVASGKLSNHSLYTYTDPEIKFDTEYSCSILSDFADVISTGYFIIEMIGLAILIVLSSMDYLKIFLNDNSDELKKANGNLAKRLGIVVVLFLLPAFINVLFSIFKIEGVNSEHPLCVQISNK